MEISRKSCRLCLSETDFNVPLNGNYCRRTNMVDKILVCLKIVIEDHDLLNTICFKCAENVERYYGFMSSIKKCQSRYPNDIHEARQRSMECSPSQMNRRHVTSYVREQVFDADYTFSFLEIPNNEEKKESKVSSPFFSYFSPPSMLVKQPRDPLTGWKTPKPHENSPKKEILGDNKYKRPLKSEQTPRHHSRDLFESQDDGEPKSLDWKLTPDDNLIKRVREKCFGRSDY